MERREGVMPPRPGPPPRAVSRRRILARRLIAVGVLLVVVVVGVVVALRTLDKASSSSAPATTAVALPPKPFRVVFPEGFTRREMAQRVTAVVGIAQRERGVKPRLSSKTYLAATQPRRIPGFGSKRRPLEGFLFPATYDFLAKTASRQLADAQLTAFRQNWRKLDLKYARSKNLTPYDVLIIASMVEKEAIAPEERAKIAAVIYNRLKRHMPLGIDATIRYGLDVPGTKALRVSQLESHNPYNTRNRLGLPPTPIANPGLASLQAAAHPAKVAYLFFVRKPDKVHHFFTASERAFINYERAHGYIR
jgi:peptidoglycan lytic transglycosylase G